MSPQRRNRKTAKRAAPRRKRAASMEAPPAKQANAVPGYTAVRWSSTTPLLEAAQALRYQRQSLIEQLDRREGTSLLCFMVGEEREIDRDDTLGFVDLLHNLSPGQAVDLMIHTGGGDIDTAEKLIRMIHARVGAPTRFRVIVPELAKSAGTLMALGAATIVMSDSSELGMIDPQFVLKDVNGNEICTSVVGYLQAYEEHSRAVLANPENRAATAMLARFDPMVIRKFQGQRDRATDIAMRMLNRQGLNSSAITEALLDLSRWKSHGQMISHADAHEIGLNITYLPPRDPGWQLYWKLHCLQRFEAGKSKKLYESAFVSHAFET
jgi:Serine dehydrogenase proteinase